MKLLRIITGLLVWIGLGAAFYWSMTTQVMSNSGSVTGDLVPALWSHAVGPHQSAELRIDPIAWTSAGDPIFIIHPDGSFKQVGEIRSIASDQGPITGERALTGAYATRATASFYPHAPALGSGASLTFYETPFSTEWIIKTLLPPEQRKAAIEDIRLTLDAHGPDILAALRPIVDDTLRDAIMVVEADLPAVIKKNESKLAELGGKYQSELLEKKLLPLIKEEVFPIAVQHGKPVVTAIGQKMWDRVSVWRFGVRFIWDRTPFADGENVKREFERFLKEDAVPILEANTGELVKLLQTIVSEAAKNKKVQAAFRDSLKMVVEDKELQKTIWMILREAVLENPRVHAVLERHWMSDRAKAAFNLAGDKLEATVIRIGDMILGTKETGITPQLARVLRYRLLHKDSRFYVLETGSSGSPGATKSDAARGALVLPVKMGGTPAFHPFVMDRKQ